MAIGRWTVGCAAGFALVFSGCVRDEVQRRPPDPRTDRLPPMESEAPPFAPDAAGNRESSEVQAQASETRLPSAPVVEGRVVRVQRDLVVLRDELGNDYALRRTPETRTHVALEQGQSVRASWQMVEDTLVATEISPAGAAETEEPPLSPLPLPAP